MMIIDDLLIGVMGSAIVAYLDQYGAQLDGQERETLAELQKKTERLRSPDAQCKALLNQAVNDHGTANSPFADVANVIAIDPVWAFELTQWLLEPDPNAATAKQTVLGQRLAEKTGHTQVDVNRFLEGLNNRVSQHVGLGQLRQDAKLNLILQGRQGLPGLRSLIEQNHGILDAKVDELLRRVPPRTHEVRPIDPKAYLCTLRERTADIDIRGLYVGSGKAQTFPIDELYITLTTSGSAESPSSAKRLAGVDDGLENIEAESRDLHEALKHRCLVVLGDPGAGKTTFLRRIAFELCRIQLGDGNAAASSMWEALADAFPVFISLADLAKHQTTSRDQKIGPLGDDVPEWLVHFTATRAAETGLGFDEAFWRSKFEDGPAIVLLDALDEVPTSEQRLELRKLIENAARDYRNCRFVVTARPAAFVGDTVLTDFEQARIAPLEKQAIETFLERWCHALKPDSEGEANLLLAELLRPLRERPEIRRLARNPVMLTALAVVHWHEKSLPEQRAELYESIIGWLAKSRSLSAGRPKPEQCIPLLQNLALAMQSDEKGRQTQVSRHWGARALATSFRSVEEEDERIAVAENFLAHEEVDSGIIVGRGEYDIRFWHLTFQEYLAARALAARADRAQRLLSTTELYAPEWREVVLLLAGVLHRQGPESVDSMFEAILGKIGPEADLGVKARCAGLLSQILRDLAPVGYEPADKSHKMILADVTAVFDAERSKEIPIEDAIEAAEAIGRAGDPRFADMNSSDLWVNIPAGRFWMGAQKREPDRRNYDPNAWSSEDWINEAPVHEVTLSEYRIGRYPVTVGEYARFVKENGYQRERFWAGGGLGKWESPEDWDEQLTHPTRPVAGVSWYEAAAYAAWAGCRLLTEAEWERAARGLEGRRYPWEGGEVPNPGLANYSGSKGGHPTPVGVYPLGRTPEGVLDMAGNVWEWCSDWYGEYPGDPQKNPSGAASGEYRVLRGGSWSSLAAYLRSAARLRRSPDLRYGSLGFRVAAGT